MYYMEGCRRNYQLQTGGNRMTKKGLKLKYNKNHKVKCEDKSNLSDQDLHIKKYPPKQFHPQISAEHKKFWTKNSRLNYITGKFESWSNL